MQRGGKSDYSVRIYLYIHSSEVYTGGGGGGVARYRFTFAKRERERLDLTCALRLPARSTDRFDAELVIAILYLYMCVYVRWSRVTRRAMTCRLRLGV